MNIKRISKHLLMMATMLLSLPLNIMAEEELPPLIIEFKTSVLELEEGEEGRTATILLGANKSETDYLLIDCGNGIEEHEFKQATLDTSTQSWIGGTAITLNVTKEGIVKIYGDASNIAMIRFDGCYITDLKMVNMPNLYYINLDHNLLHSLDLSQFSSLRAISVTDNPFDEKPLKIGGNKPYLQILEMGIMSNLDQSFNLSDYPELVSFDAYANKGLKTLDPSGCPKLQRLAVDGTNVKSLDLSKNPIVTILNISDSGIKEIDLSNLGYLQQLYLDHQSSTMNTDAKFTSLDVTKNEKLVYLFANGNNLKSIDLSKNAYLQKLYVSDNQLENIDLSKNENLVDVILRNNNMDFATLPFPNEEWNQYDYYQRNMPIAKTVKVGDVLDYSHRVLREGTTTTCAVFTVSEEEAGKTTLLSEDFYTYENGKVSFLQAPKDSIFIAFVNDKFPDLTMDYFPLRTNKFKVKTAEDFGKEDITASLSVMLSSNGAELKMKVGMAGATPENPKTFYIADAYGVKKEFTATSSGLPETVNVDFKSTSGSMMILVPQDEVMTALSIENLSLLSLDITQARSLNDLRLIGTNLYSLDLGYNLALRKLVATGNHFTELNIRGINDRYQKNFLSDINLSNNEMTTVSLNDMGTINHLNLSNNKLTELLLKDADNMVTLDLSNNALETVNLSYCSLMTDCNISNNNISIITMPEEISLKNFDCSNNNLSFPTLPVVEGVNYTYTPQKEVVIATKAPGIDLEEHNLNGKTVYTWKTTSGETLAEGTDYRITDGMTTFLDPAVGKTGFCEMTNEAFPELIVNTTKVEIAEMPTNVIGTFTTTENGTGTLILRAHENTTICIDWRGNGSGVHTYNVTNDIVQTAVKTHANSECKVYSYDENAPLYVFSIRDVKMKNVDLTNMKNLVLVNITRGGISEIKLPESTNLSELILEGNEFENIDLSKYASQLRMISLNNNKFKEFDASPYKNIFSLTMGNNEMTSITLDNPNLYNLDLCGNQLSTLDLSKANGVSQLFLTNNQFESIDLSPLKNLVALYLDRNRFKFSTLPVPNSKYALYLYANQAPVKVEVNDGIVDLATEAYVEDTPTTYRWFINDPWINEETGELEGEELYYEGEDKECSIVDGKTYFLKALDNLVCAMTNEKFPNLTLFTEPVTVKEPTGIENVETDATPLTVYDIMGRTVSNLNSLRSGEIYIVKYADGKTKKVMK